MLFLKAQVLCVAFILANAATNKDASLVKSINNFSINLLKELQNDPHNKTKNILVSPMSVYLALAMTAEGAARKTLCQMQKGLELLDDSDSTTAFQNIIKGFSEPQDGVLISVSNKILVANNVDLKQEFEENVINKFNSSILKYNTKDVKDTLIELKKWLNKSTNGKISEIVTEEELKTAAVLLLNAVYFKADWKEEFNKKITRNLLFYSVEGEKMVKTMFKSGNFEYGELTSLQARFVRIPYKNEEYKMTIILPNEDNNVTEVIKKLTPAVLDNISKPRISSKVMLHLPKFKIKSSLDLKAALIQLGLTDMFDEKADFSNMSTDQYLFVDNVKQDAVIDVNEKGSEAAAVTKVELGFRSLDDEEIFRVNRPSVFLITKNDAIMFSGVLRNPSYKNGPSRGKKVVPEKFTFTD